MYQCIVKISFISFVLFLAIPTLPLRGQVPVQILLVDTNSYPHISLTVKIREPHLNFVKKRIDARGFQVSEIYKEQEKRVRDLHVKPLPKKRRKMNIVFILDASLSLQAAQLASAISFTRQFIRSLHEQEEMALYSAKEEPVLLHDFTKNREKLKYALNNIRHNGKVTRLYDAIYSSIYTAKSAWHSGSKTQSRAVVVLLTDGKEESSYLNDEDCFELSSIGKRLSVPIYTILFNKEIEKAGLSLLPHYARLKRLSLKTQGRLIVNPNQFQSLDILQQIRQANEKSYLIRYLSKGKNRFPGSKVIVRVSSQERDYAVVAGFRVPWFYLQDTNISMGWFIFGLFFLFSLVSIFFALSWRRSQREKEERLRILETQLIPESGILFANKERKLQEKHEKTEGIVKENKKRTDVTIKDQKLKYAREPIIAEEEAVFGTYPEDKGGADVLIENERVLYLRERNYRMLQLALRDTFPYRKAALRTVMPSDLLGGAPSRSRVYDLFLENTLLGTGRWAHIPVRDPVASPVHARIKKINTHFILYDMMSGSGLYLNGNKILRPTGLKHGDEIRIGRLQYTFIGKV